MGENSDATWNLDGGEAVLSVLHIAQNSGRVAAFNLNNNGRLTATEVTTGNASSSSTLNWNGGTLAAANGANGNFLHGLTAVNVLGLGAKVDTGTNVINFNQPLLDGTGGGGLTKLGTGTLYLNGVNTYTGPTLVSAGALGGSGTIAGSVTVSPAGAIAPIGTLTVNNDVTLGGETLMEVSAGGVSDRLAVSGNIAFGGILKVVAAGQLAMNDTLNLFDWGTINGTFSQVLLPAGYTFDTTKLYVDGTIRVTSVPPPGGDPVRVINGVLVLTGTGGTPGGSYAWLTSPNVAAPMATWTTNTVGTFDANGSYSNGIPVDPSTPARFFRLKTP